MSYRTQTWIEKRARQIIDGVLPAASKKMQELAVRSIVELTQTTRIAAYQRGRDSVKREMEENQNGEG